MDLIKTFEPSVFVDALSAWHWLDFSAKTPIATSLFGDTFFAAADGYWYLSTLDGSLTRQ